MKIEDLRNIRGIKEYAQKIQTMIDENDSDIDYDEIYNEFGIDVVQLDKEMRTYSPKLDLGYKKLNSEAVSPKYNYEGDSGFDLYSIEDLTIPPFGRTLVSTGLAFNIKDGYEIQVRSKSGLAINQGLFVLNSPGTVDSGYLGEVKVILFNTNKESVTIKKGMKVGQAVLSPVVNGKWVELVKKDKIDKKDRGDKGFGSTGI